MSKEKVQAFGKFVYVVFSDYAEPVKQQLNTFGCVNHAEINLNCSHNENE